MAKSKVCIIRPWAEGLLKIRDQQEVLDENGDPTGEMKQIYLVVDRKYAPKPIMTPMGKADGSKKFDNKVAKLVPGKDSKGEDIDVTVKNPAYGKGKAFEVNDLAYVLANNAGIVEEA